MYRDRERGGPGGLKSDNPYVTSARERITARREREHPDKANLAASGRVYAGLYIDQLASRFRRRSFFTPSLSFEVGVCVLLEEMRARLRGIRWLAAGFCSRGRRWMRISLGMVLYGMERRGGD